jgi:hypothetical protein
MIISIDSPDDVSTQLEAVREQRAKLREELAARATPTATEELEREMQALAAEQALDEAQRKHGAKQVRLVQAGDMPVVVRRPHWVAFRKFQDQQEFTYEGTEELVLGCLLHPDRRTFSRHLEAQSGVLAKVASACVELAGFKIDEVKKK